MFCFVCLLPRYHNSPMFGDMKISRYKNRWQSFFLILASFDLERFAGPISTSQDLVRFLKISYTTPEVTYWTDLPLLHFILLLHTPPRLNPTGTTSATCGATSHAPSSMWLEPSSPLSTCTPRRISFSWFGLSWLANLGWFASAKGLLRGTHLNLS